jgi:hypothetical protein
MSVTPLGKEPSIVRAAVEFAATEPLIQTPEPMVALTGSDPFQPAAKAKVRRLASLWLVEIVKANSLVLPCRLFMPIAPDGTPASVRTFVWFRLIVAVAERPSSTFT